MSSQIDEVWENMMDGFSGYWADEYATPDNGRVEWYKDENFSQPNPQPFKVLCEGEWYEVTPQGLVNAYLELKRDGWTHCNDDSIDDSDSCTGDAILQYAVFGDLVYG